MSKVLLRRVLLSFGAASALFGTAQLSQAQYPVDVERSAAQGEYFEALVQFDKLPRRIITPASRLAAAKSAWALGLTERAAKAYDDLIRDPSVSSEQRSTLLIGRGILEFQQDRYQNAALFAEKAEHAANQEPDVRAKAYLLWGESLSSAGSWGLAEEKYRKALELAQGDTVGEVHYFLGVCLMKLGRWDDAAEHMMQVPLRSERAVEAIRKLGEIASERGKFSDAAYWLKKGATEFPDQFLDSWVDFILTKDAISRDDNGAVAQLRELAGKKFPASDVWVSLLNAEAELYAWGNK